MKVLFVVYNYSSFNGGAATRIVSGLIEEFGKNGIKSDVLTTKEKIGQPLKTETPQGNIYRIENSKVLNYKKLSCGFFKKGVIALKKLLDKLYLKKPQRFYSRCVVNDFFKGLKKLDVEKYDCIIPVCAEYAIYAAIEKYRRKKGLQKKIVVYQLDPLCTNSVYSTQSFVSRLQMEQRMVQENALVTTEILKKQKEEKGINTSNVVTLEFPSIVEMPKIAKNETKEIRIVFAGFLYRDIRNPEYALQLFSQLNHPEIKLSLIGDGLEELVNYYVEQSSGRIIKEGTLSLEETKRRIGEADFLLNIGNNDIHFVPSKIFDYISTGKPIINTFKDPACPTLKYFTKYDNVLCIDENAPIENELIRLEEFIKTNYNKVLSYEEITKNFKENTVEFVAEKFIKVLIENIDKTNGDKNGTV